MIDHSNELFKLNYKCKEYQIDLVKNVMSYNNIEIFKFDVTPRRRMESSYIKFNNKCNLKCIYCYQSSENKSKINNRITHEEWKIIENMIDCESMNLTLFGGEPLLDNNVDMVVKLFEKLDLKERKIRIFTNATYSKIYNQLLFMYRNIISHLIVTIDGPEEIHNSRRISNINGYLQIINNLKFYNENDIPAIVQVNIDKNNVDYVNELLSNLRDELDINKNMIVLNRVLHTNTNLLDLDFLKIYVETKKHFPNVDINYPTVDKLRSLISNQGVISSRCGAGITKVYDFDSKEIYTCPENSSLVVGSFEGNNVTIYSKKMDEIRKYHEFKTIECNNCSLRSVCKYGCYLYQDLNCLDCKKVVNEEVSYILENYDFFASLNK